MLIYSTFSISVAILSGLIMAFCIFTRKPLHLWLRLLHLSSVAIGAVLAILVAFETWSLRLWGNIGLSVIVALLGILLGIRKIPAQYLKTFLVLHGILAVICYGILVFNTFAV